ncbi:YigZ family protein [Methylomarinum vadi]|uniref:YigZ family protein n=1 Tax=Methylomarinum vadi TaxID=438855 RepID=UPI0004DEE879|nr:YigZ family protein [Methylomarinum vadi]
MKIVKQPATAEDIIKKSRFIGVISPCQSEQEIHALLQQLHEQHPNANHIVFAYRMTTDKGLICRFYDAGEPSGTAGKPIFQHLEGKDLMNAIIVVVRYFGGIKLGAGGLTRAYGNCAKKVIEAADIADYVAMAELDLTLEYNQMQILEYQLKKLDGHVLAQDFGEKIRIRIRLPEANVPALKDSLH